MDRRITIKSLVPQVFLREFEKPRDYFDALFYQPVLPLLRKLTALESNPEPALEIRETDSEYIIKAELPGIQEKDLDVSVVDHTLSIKGEKKCEEEVKDEGLHYCEVSYGTFRRTVNLPANADVDKIEAVYENGILELTVTKLSETKPRKVTVARKKKVKETK